MGVSSPALCLAPLLSKVLQVGGRDWGRRGHQGEQPLLSAEGRAARPHRAIRLTSHVPRCPILCKRWLDTHRTNASGRDGRLRCSSG